jgi:hypothetical protein
VVVDHFAFVDYIVGWRTRHIEISIRKSPPMGRALVASLTIRPRKLIEAGCCSLTNEGMSANQNSSLLIYKKGNHPQPLVITRFMPNPRCIVTY